MRSCCVFSYTDAPSAIKQFEYEIIKDLGKKVYEDDGTIKHSTYMWDTGGRRVVRCKKCNAVFLYQWSEFHNNYGDQDSYYEDYFLVKDLEEAILLNNKYSGYRLEMDFKGLKLWTIDDVWYWNKKI